MNITTRSKPLSQETGKQTESSSCDSKKKSDITRLIPSFFERALTDAGELRYTVE